jgi:anaerobic selenocysteine-containing dehydrogenase
VRDQHGAGAIAVLASPHCTNEALAELRRLAETLGVGMAGFAVIRGPSDDLLLKAEKAPNARGARVLGWDEAGPLLAALRDGGIRGLLCVGHDFLHAQHLGGTEALAGLDALVSIDTHASPLLRVAHVVLPARHAAEKHGTFVSYAGRVQRVRPAVEPPFEAFDEGELAARLGAALGLPGFDGKFDVLAVSRGLGELAPALQGRDLESVGDQGLPLDGRG